MPYILNISTHVGLRVDVLYVCMHICPGMYVYMYSQCTLSSLSLIVEKLTS